MLNPSRVYEYLKSSGLSFFVGVPDSLLKYFCAYVNDYSESDKHIIAANEGSAIGLAAGYYLGSKLPAVVYMQNSGIGNAINPLISLADPEVYSIPMLLIVGWRGEPSVSDEPQHIKQGRIMEKLLNSLEVPWFILDSDSNPEDVLGDAIKLMNHNMGPVVVLVKKNIFCKYEEDEYSKNNFLMTRESVIKEVINYLSDDDFVISTTGMTSRELYECRESLGMTHSNDFLTVGSMGHASSIAMGVALVNPNKRIFCLDGDGALIMHMGALSSIGQHGSSNLVHIVINNGAHDSVGGQPTVGFGISLVDVAKACGYKISKCISSKEELEYFLLNHDTHSGPIFLEVKVNKGSREDLGRPLNTPIHNRNDFMKKLICNE
jgi:phosphonopyruvate decarboxylase